MASIFDNSKSSTRVHAANWDKLLHALDSEALSSAAFKARNARNKFDAVSGVVAVNGKPVAQERDMDCFDAAISQMQSAEKEMSATLTRSGNGMTEEKARDVARLRMAGVDLASKDSEAVVTLTLDTDDPVIAGILKDEAQRVLRVCASLGVPARLVEGKVTPLQ